MTLSSPSSASTRIALLERKLARADAARLEAERLLDERARVLDRLNRELQEREQTLLHRLELKNQLLLRAQRTAQIATLHESSNGDLFFSREFGAIVGLPENERPSRETIMRVVHPLDRTRVARAQAHFFTEHPPDLDFTVSNRVCDVTGAIRWLRWTFRRTYQSSDDWSVSGTVQDITNQRASERRAAALNLLGQRQMRRLRLLAAEAEEARRLRERSAAFLEVVMNTIPQGIAVFDERLRLALWNSRVPDLTEIEHDDLYRSMPFDAFAALHRRHDPKARGDHLVRDEGGQVLPQRFERTLSDGRVVEVDVRRLSDGGMVKTYADVTGLKAIEGSLRKQGDELSRRVTELETLSTELRQSQREAEHANRSKSQFLAMMSHDIRTPLNGVVGMLSILGSSALNDDQRRQVDLARTAGEQLRILLDDVVEIVRAEAGKLDLSPAPVALRATVEGVVEFWRATLTHQQLRIEHHIDAALPERISVDPTRLRQLLDNFISNAIKYTNIGRVHVRAKAIGAVLRIEVEDSGPGIAKEQQAILFTDFGRLRTMSPGHTPGAGLGLAICQRIVAAMGGELGVESELGNGSCFWFQIPLVAVASEQATAERDELRQVRTRDGRRPRVLIAEDIETNRLVLAMMLHLLGCDHESVGDGLAAVEAVSERAFDLVLMDVQMPCMDGLEATRTIRALSDEKRNVPIIGVTAHALRSERAMLLAAGMDLCLSKPVQRQLLGEKLHDLLSGEAPVRQSQEPILDSSIDQLIAALPARTAATIMKTALADLTRLRDELVRSQRGGDIVGQQRARHSLKGVASNIGAVGLLRALDADEVADPGVIDHLLEQTAIEVRQRLNCSRAA